jgi:choline dehydrogenase-like flavoprotein
MTDKTNGSNFVDRISAGTAAVTAAASGLEAMQSPQARHTDAHTRIVATLGQMFIPSKPGDPGYAELEPHGITSYVMQESVPGERGPDQRETGVVRREPTANWLEPEELVAFNDGARQFFGGKTFVELDDNLREQYLSLIVEGSKISDAKQRARLQAIFEGARRRILGAYYSNYPQHKPRRDAQGLPIVDAHQISNPNTSEIRTGWDLVGYKGQFSWEEEEQLRARAKRTLNQWVEGDLVRLDPRRPRPAASRRVGGHDYYDVIVLGGGTAGCIVGGRLAERGINPKTGDRLRVAMIEGGDDWTVRDPAISPGYGQPVRRRVITNIDDGIGPDGRGGPSFTWPGEMGDGPGAANFKSVGGCSLHWGGQAWIPGDEDFGFYRQASGVNWDAAKFGAAIQEARDMLHVQSSPDSEYSYAHQIWADAGKALGFEMRPAENCYLNSVGTDRGNLSRLDSKGTALPWAYIGLNNGLRIIPNAEIEKIVIERVAGSRPVAVGAVYKDREGRMHEVRAARVIVALGSSWMPLLLYRSGYGPRDYIGDRLIVENNNVGANMSGDWNCVGSGHLAEPIWPEGLEGELVDHQGPWCATTPRPWGEMTAHVRSGDHPRGPGGALHIFAPPFGWAHKEYMRNSFGARHYIDWRTHFGAIPATWRVHPEARLVVERMDEPRIAAALKETVEILRSWQDRLPIKAVRTNFRPFFRPLNAIPPQHRVGTARAGSSPQNSVCTSDFDCHDIDNLLFTSSATVPRTFFWSMVPTCVNACYGWRRMLANHFSTGSSTKGFA